MVLTLLSFAALSMQAAPKPNVVLIMTDDQGYGDLSCHGHPWLKTPNLDQLHAEGVRLTDYHASPLCGPSRATLMTGRYCRNVAFHTNPPPNDLISRETPTMANVFAANGYRTGIFGKWHLGDYYPHRAIDRGFQEAVVHGGGAISTAGDVWGNDYFDDRYLHNGRKTQYEGFCTDVFFDEATRFIKQSTASGKPFFCYIPTNVPHGPHFAPEEYVERFEGKPHPNLFAALAHFDHRVGAMRTMLEDSGLAENTIFIYCTDNGSPRSYSGGVYSAGMTGGKGSSYEGGHRVPFFIHWPDGNLTGGRDVNQLSSNLDILPTLMDFCQLETPENQQTDGISLKPVLEGTENRLGARVLVESFNGVVMTNRWRLMHHPKFRKNPEFDSKLLYNMPEDPAQANDVAEAHPEVVSRFDNVLERVNAKNDNRQQRYIIGSQQQNPTEFTPSSWSDRVLIWQSGIRNGTPGSAPIFAEVETPGTYRFSLRRWPAEMNEPIRSAPEMTVPDGFEGKTRAEKGKALAIIKARLKVPGFDKTIEVTEDMVEATFTMPLKKGDCDILAEFVGADGKAYGAYFLSVERTGATDTTQPREPTKRYAAVALHEQAKPQLDQTSRLPNIVLILADDMGKDSVSAFNRKLGFKTPRIDQLVTEGMTFTEAHSGSAICSPTRYGLLTGRYAWRSRLKRGVVMEWEVPLIEEGRLTLADTLKRKGYDTACIGKWHLGWNWPFKSKEPVPFGKAELLEHALKGVDWSLPVSGGPVDLGFDYYFGDGTISSAPFVYIENDRVLGTPDPNQKWTAPDSDWAAESVLPTLTDKSVSYIEKQAKTDDPFFLYFSMSSPHSPTVPSSKFKGISGISPYADFVIQTDDSIGQIINAVDRAGIAENTLIIVTSDNGTALNLATRVGLTKRDGTLDKGVVDFEVNVRGGKFNIEEGGHKVPFIVRWKGQVAPGTTNGTPVCLTDIMATAADIAGYDLPDSAAEDSVSLLPALMNKPFQRDPIINHDAPGDFAIRSGDWKLTIRATPKGLRTAKEAGLSPLHLYNIRNDPRELNNVADQYPERVSRLTRELRAIISNGRSTPGAPQQNAGETWIPDDASEPAKRSAAIAAQAQPQVDGTSRSPNIVFMMSDDHKATAMGCMGNKEIETPNLDRLAGRGVLFERCYATSPLCNPSRVTTMTGMYEYKTGANFSVGPLAKKDWLEFSYPMLLKKAGYRTAFAGKWGFSLSDDHDYMGDFEAWGGFYKGTQGSYVTKENKYLVGYSKKYPHVSRALGAFGSDFIVASAKSGEPFCLSISFKTPHSPNNVIDPLDQGRYEGVTFPKPLSFGQAGLDRLATQAKLGRQYLLRKGWGPGRYQDSLRRYYQLISGMDAGIGMVLQALKEAGVADNTVVIYTSDNGYHCGDHGLQGKMLPYDSSAQIPLIIYDPRSPSRGKKLRNSSVVGNIDFAPTILDLAGVKAPEKMDGVSLRRLIDDPTGRVRDKMLVIQNWGWMVNDHNRALAVVSEDWKYINWCYADKNVPPAEELFHLKKDPHEMNNVAGNSDYSETLAKYQKFYDQYHETWVKESVDMEAYTRMGKIFDRHLPWEQKKYQVNGSKGKSTKKWPDFLEIYKELTGKEYKMKP